MEKDENIVEMIEYAEEYLENPFKSYLLSSIQKKPKISDGPGKKKKK